jgi:hypothetical protein
MNKLNKRIVGIGLAWIGLAAMAVAPTLAGASLIRDYELNGSLADALGGPSLTADGGTLGATRYSFGANQGLSLATSALASNSVYTIELVFEFDQFNSWRKIIDFNALTTDDGFYFSPSNQIAFYPAVNGGPAVTTPTDVHVVLTRDAAGNVTLYPNGTPQAAFSDPAFGNIAVFRGADNLIHFFEDDAATSHAEASRGSVDCIRIYDSALSSSAVANLTACGAAVPPPPNNTPEPGTIALVALGLLGLVWLVRTRR